MVTIIKSSKYPLVMNTNAGSKLLNKQANVIGFRKVWFDETQMANIFGVAGTVDQYRVTYDSAQEDSFNVYTKYGIIKFKNGLYTFKPKRCFLEEVAQKNHKK